MENWGFLFEKKRERWIKTKKTFEKNKENWEENVKKSGKNEENWTDNMEKVVNFMEFIENVEKNRRICWGKKPWKIKKLRTSPPLFHHFSVNFGYLLVKFLNLITK